VLKNLLGLPLPPLPSILTRGSANVYILPRMDVSALNSSPPSGTALRDSNRVFNEAIAADIITTPTRGYAKRITTHLKKQTTKVILLEKELKEA